jgi:hypothetical protein
MRKEPEPVVVRAACVAADPGWAGGERQFLLIPIRLVVDIPHTPYRSSPAPFGAGRLCDPRRSVDQGSKASIAWGASEPGSAYWVR